MTMRGKRHGARELPFLDRWCLLMREILSQIAPRASPARCCACLRRQDHSSEYVVSADRHRPSATAGQPGQAGQPTPALRRPQPAPHVHTSSRCCGRAHFPRNTGHCRRCARVLEAIEVNYARPQTRSESSTSTLSAARRRKLRRPLPPGAVTTGDSRGGGCERPGTPQAALPLPRRHIPIQNTRLRAGMVEGGRAPQLTECSLTFLFLIAARRRGVCSGRGGRGRTTG